MKPVDHKLCTSPYRRWYKDDLCALAFKVLHDKQRGPLVFLRIYSGTLKPQSAVHNINRNSTYVALITRRNDVGQNLCGVFKPFCIV